MKQTTPLSIKLIFMVFCMFSLGITYSQDKNQSNKTLFGKPVKSGTINPNNGLIRCATTEYEEFLREKNPKRMSNAQFEAWLTPLVAKYKVAKATSKTAAPVITIPVVVHVVHSGQAIGTAPNITDAQIQSQITVLTQDFRKMLGTRGGESTNPVAADVEIEFVLAKQDPNGNPTNGIDRVYFAKQSWSESEIETILKPSTSWDPALYLNMWSLKFTRIDLLGYAQFPDNNFNPLDPNYLEGLNSNGGPANTDGVVSSYDVFGSSDFSKFFLLATPYDKGRTMTHEVGHWLGLKHIWGENGSRDSNIKDCNGSDYCDDTPKAGWENYECLTTYDSCPTDPGNDMTENYMDYTNDACMNIFTQNQKDRITVIMNNAARRASLKTSTKANPIPLFVNDAEVKIEGGNYVITTEIANCNSITGENKKVALYNRGTANLTSVTLNYTIGGGANQTYTWNGSLLQNQSAVVTLPNSIANGTLNVTIATANGGADQRTTNNSATATFTAPAAPSNYNLTAYTFQLQQDKWGSETTWYIKNGSGATLYSGGPYEDMSSLPALITENWTLASNECYTFTINDAEGDGICCGIDDGNGYYNIKSTDGLTTIKSGSDFGESDTKSFTTSTLGIEEFETTNEIYLYPNPTKSTLTIQIPSNFGLPNSYAISNVLGQKMIQKVVSQETDLTINTSSLSSGIYFITVVKEEQKKTLRFIKE